MQVRFGGLYHPQVLELIETHQLRARAEKALAVLTRSISNSSNVLAWIFGRFGMGKNLRGMGALKRLAPDHYEVKPMHTAQALRRSGIGGAMLRHTMAVARSRGASRLSLETGTWDYFRPERTFYLQHGFHACEPFGDYVLDPNSVFMTIELNSEGDRP